MGKSKKKMKISITILALFVIGYSTATLGTPAKTSYCMGRVDKKTTCSACFNWGTGTVGARELSSTGTCLIKVTNAVTSCLIYNGKITKTKAYNDCIACNKKIWLNIAETKQAITSIGCSDTAIVAKTCLSKVLNCGQNMCPSDVTNSKVHPGCRQCAKGYIGLTKIENTASTKAIMGYKTCT